MNVYTFFKPVIISFGLLLFISGCSVFNDNPGTSPSTNGGYQNNQSNNNNNNTPASNNPAVSNNSPHNRERNNNNNKNNNIAITSQNSVDPNNAKTSDVGAAIRNKNYAFLAQVCRRKVNINYIAGNACRAWLDYLKDTKNGKKLLALCSENPSSIPRMSHNLACRYAAKYKTTPTTPLIACNNIEKKYAEMYKNAGYGKGYYAYRTGVRSAVKCKNWNFLFNTLLISNSGSAGTRRHGFKALKYLDKHKIDVILGLVAYLKNNKKPFSIKYGCNAAKNFTLWMQFYKKFDIAKDLVKYMKKVTKCAKTQFANYFFSAGVNSKKAISFFHDQLLSQDPKALSVACKYLSNYGSKKHLRRLRIISKTNSAYKVRNFVKVYWVRDICKNAIGQIRLR
jgi:hypothetical protein